MGQEIIQEKEFLEEIIIQEVLRYIAVPTNQVSEQLKQQISRCYTQILQKSMPKWTKQINTIHIEDSRIEFIEAGFCVESQDLAKVLTHSESAYLIAATLGAGVDRLIKERQWISMSEAVILDACASVYIEQVCDKIEADIMDEIEADDYMTMRYSPGYGDVSLAIQEELLMGLQAPKQMGLNVSRSGMLVPSKSITAFIGISKIKQDRLKTCSNCMLNKQCAYRKRGECCGS